ncbi:S9 family peptidase [Xanthovirga aplysinae]|uniref:S9 family peptidase n=1 Tax=Xanthovirga aplysinae TaxID=2529853 RepID=UPI0012BC184B|nr:prolyl oligopeptidase family serine peptidase [Xanthovirga aplysinae]MTI32957.1 S9 family peptidase [Xanthovirga aplysinae]
MKKILFICLMLVFSLPKAFSQLDIQYQKPDKAILDLADAPMTPSIFVNNKGSHIILLERNRYKSIAELSQKELRLAGLRIDPVTNISSRQSYSTGISIQEVGKKEVVTVKGLPENSLLSNYSWSPDQSKLAFTNNTTKGIELWILDINTATAKKLTSDNLNANTGRPFTWFRNGEELLVKVLPENRKPLIDKTTAIPQGPRVSVNDGKKAQNRTYQDLLKDKADEFNFEQLVLSDLYKVSLTGEKTKWKKPAMYDDIYFSPDGNYVMVSTIEKPFSYLVPFYRFPSTTVVYDKNGQEVKTLLKVPLIEDLPKGFMAVRKGKRNLRWRSDKSSTVVWAEALDEGDPENEVEFRDALYQLDAPFNGEPRELMKTTNRYGGATWGNDNTAVVYDYWWNTRMQKTYLINPSNNNIAPKVLSERNYQDRYNDPGDFVTKRNQYGLSVLEMDGKNVYLNGRGYSKEGIRPFIDRLNLKTGKKVRLWRADGKNSLERIHNEIDIKKGLILTSIQSKNTYPNYYLRNIKSKKAPQQITFTENPFKSLENVHKEVIKYKREDGVELSATLYLPLGYDKTKKEKVPMILWAYPREFKDKSSAGQVTVSDHEFTYPWYGSPIFWVTKGYAVLDDAAFPIIGEDDEEPNDTFVKQLVGNAKAAIDAVDKLGYIDRERVAVGGHSYGAFMTANLLSHSDLFAAGIARSGAYNRTLTPFGFQSEERTYWDAPEIYYEMSPFMHSDKMKTPLLLIHGEADNNSGTYPMQSERYFNALKGLGATVRLVILPKESHGYRAKESILHLLWEQDQWLEKHVKNKKETVNQ